MAITFVVPDTVEHAVELLHAGLLYCNDSSSVPRDPNRWRSMAELDRDAVMSLASAETFIRESATRLDYKVRSYWHYTDFAYVVED